MNKRNKMLYYLSGSFRQSLSYRAGFLIISIAFCVCLDTWNQLPFLWTGARNSMAIYYYIFNSLTFGGHYVPYLVPMLSVAVYTISYYKESSTGMDAFIIGRLGSRRKYAVSKLIASSISGGVISVMGFLLFIVVANRFQPLYLSEFDMEASGFPYFKALSTGNGVGYFIIIFYLIFINAVLWNTIALLCSAYFKNVYVTIASPLLLSYFLSRIYTYLRAVPKTHRTPPTKR
ncbi:hypothetical protein CG709_07975, partial [Lachnotalea glycerini]